VASPLPVQIVLVGKAPTPGRSKTRLTPPLSPTQAAEVAAALLVDAINAVNATPVVRRVMALDGAPGPWLPAEWDLLTQRGGDLGERLCQAALDAYDVLPVPVLLLVTDTPLLTPALLSQACGLLLGAEHDAVLGHAPDGGWWTLGMRRPHPRAFLGVPMSTDHTGKVQRQVLERLGMRTARLPELSDIDVADDLVAIKPYLDPASELGRVISELSADVA
jgi:rSAM/selenodomain-associated transferase 1